MSSDVEERAKERFGDLTPAELELLRPIPHPARSIKAKHKASVPTSGKHADSSSYEVVSTRRELRIPVAADPKSFGPERTIRSEFLRWVCLEREASLLLNGSLDINNAYLKGRLNLSYLTIPIAIACRSCWIPDGIEMVCTNVPALTLDGSWLGPTPDAAPDEPVLLAEGIRVAGTVSLRGKLHCAGEVWLVGAQIGGDLTCSSAHFKPPGGAALNADRAEIRGDFHLREGFASTGGVRLRDGKIRGSLDCSTGAFHNPNGEALNANGAEVSGDVLLSHGFQAEGAVTLEGAKIAGSLNCSKASFDGRGRCALMADASVISRSVFLAEGMRALGETRLRNSVIHGDLVCTRGMFTNPGSWALNLEAAEIRNAVFLGVSFDEATGASKTSYPGWGFVAEGEVRLFGAAVGSNLICHKGYFRNPGRIALNVERARIGGAMVTRLGFEAHGEVRVFGAEIGGDLECRHARFINPEDETSNPGQKRPALRVDRAKIGGDLDLSEGFEAQGEILVENAAIGGHLNLTGANLVGGEGSSIRIRSTEIKRSLKLERVELSPNTTVDLKETSCAVLHDDKESWPKQGKLRLDTFEYRSLTMPGSYKDRLEWLRRQLKPEEKQGRYGFRPQPYHQCANTLRAQGLDKEAKSLLIGMAVDRRKFGGLNWLSRAWQFILWASIRNGYQPLRALVLLVVLWVIGFFVFGMYYQGHYIVPSDNTAFEVFMKNGEVAGSYEPFCATIYAVDTSLPIISFGQRDKWHLGMLDHAKSLSDPPGLAERVLCKASFTRNWIAPAPASGPDDALVWMNLARCCYLTIGWFLTTMLVAGVSGLIGRD